MKVKVFYPNREGKIEFTCQELEKLLDEVYREGQKDCNCSKSWTWATPYSSGYSFTPCYNGSLTGNSITGTTVAIDTDNHATDTTATIDNAVVSNFKVDTTGDTKEANPYSITLGINEADVNKAAETIKAMFNQKGAITTQKIGDVFSGLAKELNF